MNKTFSFYASSDLWSDERSYQNRYLLCLIEDIESHAFPVKLNDRSPIVTLQNEDDKLLDLFTSEHNDIDNFFRNYFKDLICYKKIAFEICSSGIEKNIELRYFPAQSLRYSFMKGKYYQNFHKNTKFLGYIDKFPKRVYFNKDDFFIIKTPKIFLKTFSNFIIPSKILQKTENLDIFLKCREQCISENSIYEKTLFQHRIFSVVGRCRFNNQEYLTEYYDSWCYLKFAKFVAIAREDFMVQMNLFLKAICKKLKLQDNKFITNNIVSSSEYSEIETKLKKNEISFKEVVNKVFNNYGK